MKYKKTEKIQMYKIYNPVIREEVQMLDTDKYNHLPTKSKCTKNNNNPITRKEVHILDNEKYNHSTRAIHPLNIGSIRNPTKSKCRKNKIIPSSARKYEQ
jgi:hypothetical protein